MGVLMQAFYWDCPRLENMEYQWLNYIATKVQELGRVGFTALWLPPACKAANIGGMSMGYDPYDYYDLGSINQKGTTPTWFGTRDELTALIGAAHRQNLQVYADLVINHNSGADAQELNPRTGKMGWTVFTPGSKQFPRNWECFHPCDYETTDGMSFGDMPDLCHRNPTVYTALLEYARWLIEEIGFDGFRYDFVKGYGAWMVRAIQELRGLKGIQEFNPFGVGECWDSDRDVREWMDGANIWSDNPVAAFDFDLRQELKQLCDSYGYSLKQLAAANTLLVDRPLEAVTFVENHDLGLTSMNPRPIINDKMLAYAYILTHEGYPCVFWQDYFGFGLGEEGYTSGIAALVAVHESFAAGATTVLHADDDLYIAQRDGFAGKPGLVVVINNQAGWNGAWVATQWLNTRFHAVAWRGRGDLGVPQDKWTLQDGTADFWAPPRGYAVYVPQ